MWLYVSIKKLKIKSIAPSYKLPTVKSPNMEQNLSVSLEESLKAIVELAVQNEHTILALFMGTIKINFPLVDRDVFIMAFVAMRACIARGDGKCTMKYVHDYIIRFFREPEFFGDFEYAWTIFKIVDGYLENRKDKRNFNLEKIKEEILYGELSETLVQAGLCVKTVEKMLDRVLPATIYFVINMYDAWIEHRASISPQYKITNWQPMGRLF